VAQDVASLVRNHGLQTGVVVISFSFDTVCDVRRADPSLATGWLTSHLNPKDVDEVVGRCLSAGIPTVSAHYPELTPETVDRCHLRGLTLYAWTIDDETVAQRYAAMGVDVIASNRPQEIMGALRD
jgi:glycerophosphoryl diester phosphodiesterase